MSAIDPAFVRFSGVSRAFGSVNALDNVHIDIARGEFFSLLGPSGCGKTTLMRTLAGFEPLDAGSITLDGENLAGRAPHTRPVNMMFQNYALFPHLSVGDNIAFGLKRQGMARAPMAARVNEMLRLVQLEGLAARKPDALSGGQKQRVALARALARGPKVLLLDEPLAALDKKLRKETQSELKRIQAESGTTFIVVTHDQDEAMALSDRLAIMRAGRIEQVGTPRAVYDAPVNQFVASFMGEMNFLPVPADEAPHARLAIRPQRLLVQRMRDASADVWHCAMITEYLHMGAHTELRLRMDDGHVLCAVQPATRSGSDLAVGERVVVGYKRADLRLLAQ